MARRQTLPLLWLLSDVRNDAVLSQALDALPAHSGFVFRHYHLDEADRRARFAELAAQARRRGHLVILAGDSRTAEAWQADGAYGSIPCLGKGGTGLRIVTAHDGAELLAAIEAGADAIVLSPVFHTRSHPDAQTLGVHGFHVLAQQSPLPVIALGGMNRDRAVELAWPRWGAIDGLAPTQAA